MAFATRVMLGLLGLTSGIFCDGRKVVNMMQKSQTEIEKATESTQPEPDDLGVDVFVGTGGHAHTFPGAATPWGMAIATPWAHSPKVNAWDTQSGFTSDTETLVFYGMAHSGLSGAGSGELGELRLLPSYGERDTSAFLSKSSCAASPGFFKGQVTSHGKQVNMESSVTKRAAIHKFTFLGEGRKTMAIVLSPSANSYWGYKLMDSSFKISDRKIEGCSLTMNTGLGSAESLLCFSMDFSVPFHSAKIGADLFLELPEERELIVKVGLSRTDVGHARLNLMELGHSPEDVAKSAALLWREALGTVVADVPKERRVIFQTALYHSMLFPQLLSEADGSYRLQRKPRGEASLNWMKGEQVRLDELDSKMPIRHVKEGTGDMYHTFSMWDTYRGLHPLINLIHPEMSKQFGMSLMNLADAWGFLPRFQVSQSPADMMSGDGGSIILGTMAREGLVNSRDAFAVLNSTRRLPVDERKFIAQQGFLLEANAPNSVSKALEQATADSCVGRLAKDLGFHAEAEFFKNRADLAFQYWNPRQQVFAPMKGKGESTDVDNMEDQSAAYQEGTALQYSLGAQFDVEQMIQRHGGTIKFIGKLDYFFNRAPEPHGQLDITGNRHGLTLGNEPAMHTPYLYSYAGAVGKTQEVVDDVLKRMFKAQPNGLPGNDDLGQLSAWAALSMLGFYPVDACSGDFVLGRPFITQAALSVVGGKFQIKVHNNSDESKYFERVALNGKDLDLQHPVLAWSEISRPGTLDMWMTSRPTWTASASNSAN